MPGCPDHSIAEVPVSEQVKQARRERHRRAFPVTVTRPAATRCDLCHIPVTYPARPGAATAALTAHYQQAHPGSG
jgi:hypothetical protein